MKTLLSILLLGLLIFNTLGFSCYSILEEDFSNSNIALSGDDDIILKFPLQIPYLTDWHNTEPSDEEILRGNEYYKVVSKQIVNDTLYVHCQFSQTSRERFWTLVSSFEDHAKTESDSHKGSSANILKNFLKEYMAICRKHIFYFFEWNEPSSFEYILSKLVPPTESIQSPPPDLA
ncbi:hypothetical protein L0657_09655 [Dyadobacter sp. CY345]|uniref:hypothetical protein n=1 Tax=Dyadobacter sp. CY345 TaxID=2909335 RepID=UPI001F229A8D|nr:hypothetical protein [Dyadobacter sp. CY345]MCF2444222.1 hypothetical protein [Dyadobacter sp. CY345]